MAIQIVHAVNGLSERRFVHNMDSQGLCMWLLLSKTLKFAHCFVRFNTASTLFVLSPYSFLSKNKII